MGTDEMPETLQASQLNDTPEATETSKPSTPSRPFVPNFTLPLTGGGLFSKKITVSRKPDENKENESIDTATPLTPTSPVFKQPTATKLINSIFKQQTSPKPATEAIAFVTSLHTLSAPREITIVTSAGESFQVRRNERALNRETTASAEKDAPTGLNYYGIDIHGILDAISNQKSSQKAVIPVETSVDTGVKGKPQLLWTEKYRAKKFTDLVGDERTHRDVLRWMKRWDRIVFPAQHRATQKRKASLMEEEPEHQKILLLHGPPGLGKTTLAHVAARQAGYEPLEINASDDRSGGVVKGKIKDMLTIEGVKSCGLMSGKKKQANAGKPVCLVIDEIDGVTGGGAGGGSGGSGGGSEAGFIKALIDLIMEDRRSCENGSNLGPNKRRSKKESFKLRRPIIAVCNDLYAPILKPLRQFAEVVQMRVPPVNLIVERLEWIFQKEGYATEDGAVRKIVELSSMAGSMRKGDMRGALVNGEWIAAKMKLDQAVSAKNSRGRKILTRKAVEDELVGSRIGDSDGKGSNGGRMVMRDALESVFYIKREPPVRGAAAKMQKKSPTTNLQELVEGLGEFGKLTMGKNCSLCHVGILLTLLPDCFATYPTKNFNDDSILTKPNTAYEWLFFSDIMSPRVQSEAAASSYLTYPILAFHHLFASGAGPSSANNPRDREDNEEQLPFSGAGADWEAYEAQKEHTSILNTIHSSLVTPQLSQTFKNPASIVMELAPFVNRMLSPQINPVLVSGSGYAVASVRRDSEKKLVARAVNAMEAAGVKFEKVRVEVAPGVVAGSGWAYRMDPPLDAMGIFPTFNVGGEAVRYAVRQVLDQEWRKLRLSKNKEAREARMGTLPSKTGPSSGKEDTKDIDVRPTTKVKRDFFGRIVVQCDDEAPGEGPRKKRKVVEKKRDVWVSYNEGFSNAVRKDITLDELMAELI